MDVQAILLIHRRTDVVLQVLGGDLDVDGVRDLHRLALDRGDHTLRLILVSGRMRRRRLGCGRVVDWGVLLLDRRGRLAGLGVRLRRVRGSGGRFSAGGG